jgi:hypothetical protein
MAVTVRPQRNPSGTPAVVTTGILEIQPVSGQQDWPGKAVKIAAC